MGSLLGVLSNISWTFYIMTDNSIAGVISLHSRLSCSERLPSCTMLTLSSIFTGLLIIEQKDLESLHDGRYGRSLNIVAIHY